MMDFKLNAGLDAAQPPAAGAMADALAAIRKLDTRPALAQRPAGAVELAGLLEMRTTKELKNLLDGVLRSGTPCILDGSGVKRLSTGGIQVLIGFFAAAEKAMQPAVLINPSEALLAGIRDLGLRSLAAQWLEEKV